MTDDLIREIEEIAKLLPSNPQGLAELRALLATIPPPSPLALPGASDTSMPSTDQQTAEVEAGGSVSTGGGATGGTSTPLPTGTISGSSIAPGTLSANAFAPSIRPIQLVDGPGLPTLPNANFPEGSVVYSLDTGRLYRNDAGVWRTPYPERGRNLLADPAFETINYGVSLLADATPAYARSTSVPNTPAWVATLTRLAGTGNVQSYFDDEYDRTADDSTFNSSLIDYYIEMRTNTTEAKLELDSAMSGAAYASDLGYVVGSIKFFSWGIDAEYTEATLTVEIVPWTNVGGVMVAGTPLAYQTVDLISLDEDIPYEVFTAAAKPASGALSVRYRLQGKRASGATDYKYAYVVLAEPQLHFSETPDPGEFSPAVSRWMPTLVQSFRPVAGLYQPEQSSSASMMALGYSGFALRSLPTDLWERFRIAATSMSWGMGNYVAPSIYMTTTLSLRDKAWMQFGSHQAWPWPEQNEWKLDIIGSLYDDGVPLRQIGWAPYAYPIGFNPAGTYTTALSIAANGGSIAIPIAVPAKMTLASVSIWNTDTATERTWNWHLYAQQAGNVSNTLNRVASGSANDTFTPGAASKRTITAGNAVTLSPGIYWLVVQNAHATSTFGLGSVASGTLSHDRAQTKTLTVGLADTLDFVAATWTKVTGIYAVVLEGKVFGQAQPIELPLLHQLDTPKLYNPTIVRL